MRWSKLKAKVESFFTDSLKGRVELRSTRYRSAHDETGRGYITVDGKEVWNMCSLKFWQAEYPAMEKIKEEKNISPRQAQILADSQLQQEGIFSQWDYYRTLEDYGNTSIESNLNSTNPLTKSLALLDARTGKRRLEKIDVSKDHPMVQYFFKLRCEVEKIQLASL